MVSAAAHRGLSKDVLVCSSAKSLSESTACIIFPLFLRGPAKLSPACWDIAWLGIATPWKEQTIRFIQLKFLV